MPENVHRLAPAGVAPGRGYSQVAWGTGRLITVSGQVSCDEHGTPVGEGDPAAQTRQVFANISRCLAEAGATLADVIKLTYFVTDIAYLPAVRIARDECIDTTRPPASSAVAVTALFSPDYLVEIEALAVIPEPEAEAGSS